MATTPEQALKKIAEAVDEKTAHVAALAAIIAHLPETAKLNQDAVRNSARQMSPSGFGASAIPGKAENLAQQILQQAKEIDKRRPSKG